MGRCKKLNPPASRNLVWSTLQPGPRIRPWQLISVVCDALGVVGIYKNKIIIETNNKNQVLIVMCCNLSCETLLLKQMEYMLLVWFNPDHWKGNPRFVENLRIHSTTQPLHQGARICQKNKSRRVACCHKMCSAKSWVWFLRGWSAFHSFNPMIMIVITMCLFCACCIVSVKWQLE